MFAVYPGRIRATYKRRTTLVKVTRTGAIAALIVSALALAACGGGDTSGTGSSLSGTIRVDGSSTVAPLAEAAAGLFREDNSGVQVTVGISGTGGGFKKFCNGEIDIADASRPIKDEERKACADKGVVFDEFTIANDALSIVVNKENNWIDCITVDQLKKIWEPKSTVNNWNQLDAKFPNVPMKLFGAGTDSGTFDYFTKAINGEEKASRTDYNATEDDNTTVTGVSGDKGGLGYFGFSYFEENSDKLKVLKVDGGSGCVEPSVATVQDASYKPLSRPLFIYPTSALLARAEGLAFLQFFGENATKIADEARFVPLTSTQVTELTGKIDALKSKAGSTPTTTP